MFEPAEIPEKLIRYLGLGNDAISLEQIPALWEKALSLCHPMSFNQEMDIKTFQTEFSPFAENSSAVKRLLKGCDAVSLLVTSIGPDLEKSSKNQRNSHHLFEGYVLDRMGSFIVESLMRDLDRQISDEYSRTNYSGTIRYSPGYQDFPLECQKIFIRHAIKKISFLRIDPNYRVVPEKTITAIKGRHPATSAFIE